MRYYSSGKLILSSEYIVLAGAKALAIPTKFGQSMDVKKTDNPGIVSWKSIDCNNDIWLKTQIDVHNKSSLNSTVNQRLQDLFNFIVRHSSTLDFDQTGYDVVTRLEFDQSYGLGSSSTLVSNLAQWANVDGIKLLHSAFQGSGYDVAVGLENKPVMYQLVDGRATWETIDWEPSFKNQLFFVHLGHKQNSEDEVNQFDLNTIPPKLAQWFTKQTENIVKCTDLPDFSELLDQHEAELGRILGRKTVKQTLFHDYDKSIKSLGAWGGDFALVVGNKQDQQYFKTRNFKTIFSWDDMVR